MQHVLVALQQEKSSCYSILIFAVSLFGCPLSFGCPGPSPRLPLLSTRHWVRSTVGYFQKAWITYEQVRLC